MTSKFTPSNPDKIEMTLSLTMSLYEWKQLKAQMSNEWPSWEIGGKIRSMIDQASTSFYPQEPVNATKEP